MSAGVDTVSTAALDLTAVEALLYAEADCLDRADLEAWSALYTDDGVYWMPVAPDQADPDSHISLFYDDRLMMEIRRRNFGHRFAASMAYPVRSSHLLGNVRIVGTDSLGRLEVASNFHAVVFYKDVQTLYAGRYTHHLVATPDGPRIARKRVDLVNCDAEHGNLVIYL